VAVSFWEPSSCICGARRASPPRGGMVAAAPDDVLNDSLAACIDDWFQSNFKHRFLDLPIVSIPVSIPKRWVEDAEVQLDDGLAMEDADILGGEASPARHWNPEEGRARLRESLGRLNLLEGHVAHPKLQEMGMHELFIEKRRVKQELKRYDVEFRRQFNRLPSHPEKEPMRPLYVYYRQLKTMLVSKPEEQASGGHGGKVGGGRRSSTNTVNSEEDFIHGAPHDAFRADERHRGGTGNARDQIAALTARISSLQEEKSSVRDVLQSFQEKFVHENHRKIRFHKDILPIEREYRMYKNLKEEIQKAETQLAELNKLQSS